MIALYILIGFIIGYVASNIQGIQSINNTLKILIDKGAIPVQTTLPLPIQLKGTGRKGLMQKVLSSTDRTTNKKTNIDVVYEVYEIERSKDKSKIGVLSIRTNQSEYSTETYKQMMKDLWEGTWVLSTGVEWLDESPELVRDEKLKDLLD